VPEAKKDTGRDGRKSECLNTSGDAGEPTRGTRRSKGGHRDRGPLERKAEEMSSSETVSTKLQRIATLAKTAPDMVITSLSHHMDMAWFREAYRRTRKDGATGVDGQTAADYEVNLEANLELLLGRAKSGSYRAPPVRRVHIPKGSSGETRPIGIPTLEDKVLQRAVAMALEAVYEQDFFDCSYGFRPGRSAHMALEDLWRRVKELKGGWVLELDFRKFFDTLDHAHLRSILAKRVRDGVLTRLIGKWLNAGVLEGQELSYPESGTPQGGVVSPLLANIYLHEVLDGWFERTVKPRLSASAFLIRYADDAVLLFAKEDDARRVMAVLPKRCSRYGLTLHPDKTRLVRFRSPAWKDSKGAEPGSFDFLGFTHYWARAAYGSWVVRRRTAKGRFTAALRRIWEWCRRSRHLAIPEQQEALTSKLRGHYGYYGILGNHRRLECFLFEVKRAWFYWLRRRSWAAKASWTWFYDLLRRHPLPEPPSVRLPA
jgi:RNA-directed DNA polymerase